MTTTTESEPRSQEWQDAASEIQLKHERAEHLTQAINGREGVRIEFNPKHGDSDSQGHLYWGRFEDPNEQTFIELDDRKEESLADQVVSEMLRISRCYRDQAYRALDNYEPPLGTTWEVVLRYADERPEEVIATERCFRDASRYVERHQDEIDSGADVHFRRVSTKEATSVDA